MTNKKILDIGCGPSKTKGAIGIDLAAESGADIIWDLNQLPWPNPDDEFDIVICSHILEHLNDVIQTMKEIHRVSKAGALVRIEVPHFSSCHSFGDLTHRHYFSYESFNGLCDMDFKFFYTEIRFQLKKRRIIFWQIHKFNGIEFFANKFPCFYEKYLSFIFPARCLQFELEVIK
jgi:SAM-dependent methyltransferase